MAAEPDDELPLTGVPLALPRGASVRAAGVRVRDASLRATLFATVAGAALTTVWALVLARQDTLAAVDASGLASYHRILMPLLALTAVVAALILERAAVLGMLLLLAATGLGLAGGGAWLLPGMLLGCYWAARHVPAACVTLGFLLLLPGVAAVYYGLLGGIAYVSQVPVRGLPPGLANALSLRQALAPIELLPLALLGAWLLVRRSSSGLD